MSNSLRTVIFMSLFICRSFAAGIVEPLAVPAKNFELTVSYGDKTTRFKIWSDKNGHYYSGNNGQNPKTGPLSDRNWKFLVREANQILKLSALPVKGCTRMKVTLANSEGKHTEACINATAEPSRKLQKMTNLLSSLM